MLSNVDIVELLETEGTLDYLLLDYEGEGIDPFSLEDETLADLFTQAKEILAQIREHLEPAEAIYYGTEDVDDVDS